MMKMHETHGKVVHHEETEPDKQGKAGLFAMLHEDHEKLRELFKKIEKSTSIQIGVRGELFTRLEQELLVHLEAEERFFYTALEQHEEARARVLESYEIHQLARIMIGSFNSLAVDDERWPAKVRVLGQIVRLHVDDEDDLFKMAKKVLANDQFPGMVSKIRELRRESKNA